MKITFEGQDLNAVLMQIAAFTATATKQEASGEAVVSPAPAPSPRKKKAAPTKEPIEEAIDSEIEVVIEEKPKSETAVSLEDVISKARTILLKRPEDGKAFIKTVLSDYKVTSVRDLKPENYAEVFKALS